MNTIFGALKADVKKYVDYIEKDGRYEKQKQKTWIAGMLTKQGKKMTEIDIST